MECGDYLELASAHLDGEASAAEVARLDQHLAGCPRCAATVAAMDEQHRRLRMAEAPFVPDHSRAILEVAGRVTAVEPARPARWRLAAVTAAVTLACALTFVLTRPSSTDEAPRLTLAAATVAPAPAGGATEVHLYVDNAGGRDRVIGASSPVAATAIIHRTEDKDGTRVMRPVTSLAIAGDAATELTGGGTHVMLVDLQRDLDPGDTVPITVQFERSGPIQLTAEVVTQRTSA